jgi:hypothetical protein
LTGNFVLKRDAILNLLEYFFFKHHEHKNHYHNHESYHQYFHPSFYLRMKHPFSKMCWFSSTGLCGNSCKVLILSKTVQ